MRRKTKLIVVSLWQAPQLLLGTCVARCNRGCERLFFEDKIVILWNRKSSAMSLAKFIFMDKNSLERPFTASSLAMSSIFRHEYGHTIQSRYLGWLYLPLIGLPSILWANLPVFKRLRDRGNLEYDDLPMEKNASFLGDRRFRKTFSITP